ncbi:hypothetical protein ECG_01650 [Echinococcus granulosus]|nr:hypothetical protein ECG_01650 [Echinococcus granulosus]
MTMAMLTAFLDAPLRRVPKRTLTKAALKLEPNFVHTNPPGPSENHTGADSADSSTMETPPISPNDLLPVKFTQVAISDWLPTNLCRTPLSWSKIAGHLWDESLVPYIWCYNADKRSGGAPPAGDSRPPDARLLIPNRSEDLSHSFPLRHHHYPCLPHHPLPPSLRRLPFVTEVG